MYANIYAICIKYFINFPHSGDNADLISAFCYNYPIEQKGVKMTLNQLIKHILYNLNKKINS